MEKTFEECCDEVAKKHVYEDWNEAYCNISYQDFLVLEKEAAELYAQSQKAKAWEEACEAMLKSFADAINRIQIIKPEFKP